MERVITLARFCMVDTGATDGEGCVSRWANAGPATVDASHRHRRNATWSYDADTRTYRWTDIGPGAEPQFFLASIDFFIGSSPNRARWLFAGRTSDRAFTLPTLPRLRDVDWSPPADGAGVTAARPTTFRIETLPSQDGWDLGRPWVFLDLEHIGGSRIFGTSGEMTMER